MNRPEKGMRTGKMWDLLARAVAATGTEEHVDRLIDLIGEDIPHDLVTVTRYSATSMPEFVKHRRFSDEMVRRYLESYYVYDPFYACWRRERRLGVVPLRTLADDEVKRGQYIAEFLAQSEICDEVGILLSDGGDWCLGIFLDRSTKPFRDSELTVLSERLPVFASLHALDIRTRDPDFLRTSAPKAPGASPRRKPSIPEGLWPELSARERDLVQLILAGHPTATIAQRLGITVGTTKNHRRRIYEKLDITTERELFLQFFQHQSTE
jgi:DNA-binding CsgD family transcriptional regulator